MEAQYKDALQASRDLLDTEKRLAEVKLKAKDDEITLLREQIKIYKEQYELLTDHGFTIGCFFKKLISIGLWGCS